MKDEKNQADTYEVDLEPVGRRVLLAVDDDSSPCNASCRS